MEEKPKVAVLVTIFEKDNILSILAGLNSPHFFPMLMVTIFPEGCLSELILVNEIWETFEIRKCFWISVKPGENILQNAEYLLPNLSIYKKSNKLNLDRRGK